MKKINLLRIFVFCVTAFILFQEQIVKIIKIDFLNYFDEAFILIMFIIALFNIIRKKKIRKISIHLMILTMLFFITGFISCSLNSIFLPKYVILSGYISIKFWLLILAIINIDIKDDVIKYFQRSLEICCIANIAVSIFNLTLPNLYSSAFNNDLVYRFGLVSLTGLFGYPEKSGWFMLFMTIYYYSKLKEKQKMKQKKIIIICAITAILSLRTKAILGLVFVLIFELIINNKINIKKYISVFFVITIVILCCKNIILNTYKLYFNFNNEDEARVILTNRGLDIMKDYFPLGVGFGKYGSYYARINYSEYYYKFGFDNIHGLTPQKSNYGTDTFWPSIIGETGFSGLLIYLTMLAIIFNYCLKSSKKQYNIFGTWAILALVQSICESFGEQSFYSPPQNVFLGIIIGISLNYFFNKGDESNEKIYIKNNNVVR